MPWTRDLISVKGGIVDEEDVSCNAIDGYTLEVLDAVRHQPPKSKIDGRTAHTPPNEQSTEYKAKLRHEAMIDRSGACQRVSSFNSTFSFLARWLKVTDVDATLRNSSSPQPLKYPP